MENSPGSCTLGTTPPPSQPPMQHALCSPFSLSLSVNLFTTQKNREGIGQLPGADGAMLTDDTESRTSRLLFSFRSSPARRTGLNSIKETSFKETETQVNEIVREPWADVSDSTSS